MLRKGSSATSGNCLSAYTTPETRTRGHSQDMRKLEVVSYEMDSNKIGAHMFWLLYESPNKVETASKPWPTILWLQGGPGSSGTAFGNFLEIGPFQQNLERRNSTWLKIADLLFVDNPVGTGFSYVDDLKDLVTTDKGAGEDLTVLLMKLYEKKTNLQRSPLYIVAESYGGKLAVTTALCTMEAVRLGKLKADFKGVGLGNSWISPQDFVYSWGTLLRDISRIDENGFQQTIRLANKIEYEIRRGLYQNATNSWLDLELLIVNISNYVSFYNFLLELSRGSKSSIETEKITNMQSTYVNNQRMSGFLTEMLSSEVDLDFDLASFMNGVVKNELKSIPKNVRWGSQSDYVFDAFVHDFMKPSIIEVGELLNKGLNVTIYNGQLDLICSTLGVESWLKKVKWAGINPFLNTKRTPLYCGDDTLTLAFFKSYHNLHFFSILGSGHFVPAENRCMGLAVASFITGSV